MSKIHLLFKFHCHVTGEYTGLCVVRPAKEKGVKSEPWGEYLQDAEKKHNASMVPIGSMYGIFTYIYHTNQPNVGKYTIHGCYGNGCFS